MKIENYDYDIVRVYITELNNYFYCIYSVDFNDGSIILYEPSFRINDFNDSLKDKKHIENIINKQIKNFKNSTLCIDDCPYILPNYLNVILFESKDNIIYRLLRESLV